MYTSTRVKPIRQQPIIIDNRPGAAGNIGVDLAAKAPADGYTIVDEQRHQHVLLPQAAL